MAENNINNYVHGTEFFNPLSVHNIDFSGENSIQFLSYIQRTKTYLEEYKNLLNLALSIFETEGFKENDIDDDFVLCCILETGSIAEFKPIKTDENKRNVIIGDVAMQPYAVLKRNMYTRPAVINIIPYISDGVTFSELGANKQLTADQFNIIYLNRMRVGIGATISYYATLIATIQQCFINNVFANSLQGIITGKQSDLTDIKQIMHAVLNQNGFIALNTGSNPQSNEMPQIIKPEINWLGNDILDTVHRLRKEFLERVGIAYSPYEKKERLTNVEIETQLETVDLLAYSTIKTINDCLEIGNEKFGLKTPLKVKHSKIGIDMANARQEQIEKDVTVDEE